jgi:hypothetical protein
VSSKIGRLDGLVAGQPGLLEHDPLDLGPRSRGRRQLVEGALGEPRTGDSRPLPSTGSRPARNGLVARSRPTVVVGPWPGSTTVSSSGAGTGRPARPASPGSTRRAGRCGRSSRRTPGRRPAAGAAGRPGRPSGR